MRVPVSVRTATSVALAAAAAIALMAAPAARSDQLPRLLNINTITAVNGVVTVSGNVGGSTVAAARLELNGHPLAIDASGTFIGIASLSGGPFVDLVLRLADGRSSELRVAVPPSYTGTLAPTLDAVQQALASLLVPVGGFKIVPGRPITIGGTLLDRGQLQSLSVNGVDVLGVLRADGSYTIQLPGTLQPIVISARGTDGTLGTVSYPVQPAASPTAPATPPQQVQRRGARASTVAAAQALGVRIARVQYRVKGVLRTGRVRMLVTVRDRRGLLVRGATVRIRTTKARRTVRRQQVARTGKLGSATFILRVRRATLGKRIFIVTTARTPRAVTSRRTSFSLPRGARH